MNIPKLPSVAVLLATFNGALYCEDQILSLLWQRDVDVHVYVRDDVSSDATMTIVTRLAEQHAGRITILDNKGSSTGSPCGNFFALLMGIDLTCHAYIAFADQDDVWVPEKLTKAVTAMATNAADAYSSDLICYHSDRNAAWMLHKRGAAAADLDYLFQGGSAGCTYVLSTNAAQLVAEVVAGLPPLCPGASHDWTIYAICRSRGLRWFLDQWAGIVYRQHAANQYGARSGWRDIVAKLRLVRRGWYRGHILWLRSAVLGRKDEREVLAAIATGGIRNRWRLFRQAGRFRRTAREVLQLRAAIILNAL